MLYCIVLYNDVFTFLYVAVGNKLLLLLLVDWVPIWIIAECRQLKTNQIVVSTSVNLP